MWVEVGDGINACAHEQDFITEGYPQIWAGRHFISNAYKGRGAVLSATCYDALGAMWESPVQQAPVAL